MMGTTNLCQNSHVQANNNQTQLEDPKGGDTLQPQTFGHLKLSF